MKISIINCLIIAAIFIQVITNVSGMVYDRKWSSSICIKSYGAGGTITEDYSNLESLNTQISANSTSLILGCGSDSSLRAAINTYAIGQAHSAWSSVNPIPNQLGRHDVVSESSEDLTGVFSIIKTVNIGPNSTSDNSTLDWVPCL
ncbi:MAG TPA: hypothetical protein VN455_08320 [Methanotrichaceae archaeon]|nr:hypothetical protein [Methanotrichaceae archaeon]